MVVSHRSGLHILLISFQVTRHACNRYLIYNRTVPFNYQEQPTPVTQDQGYLEVTQ